MTIFAHRGVCSQAPENTMAAFRLAADRGFAIELDVGLCRSGEPVVIHDDVLDRTTSGIGPVATCDLRDLRLLDAGKWFGDAFRGERIPLLDEVLDAFGSYVPIDIELKPTEHRQPLVQAVVDRIEQHGLIERVMVTSFDPFILEQVRRRNPEIRRGQIYGTLEGTNIAWWRRVALKNLVGNRWAVPDALIVEHSLVNAPFVTRMHRRGYRIFVWTVNEETEMRRLLALGVDGIITDYPDVLQPLQSTSSALGSTKNP